MSLVNMDFSSLPMPGTYEVVNASLEFNAINVYQNTLVAVGETTTAWTESSVYAYPAGNTSTWANGGAYSVDDFDIPFNPAQWVNDTGTTAFNVTALVHHALANNLAELDVVLFAVGDRVAPVSPLTGAVDGRVQFASSEASNIDVRPRLNLTYRIVDAWVPSQPTGLTPLDGTTLWNTSKPRPSGLNSTDFTFNLTYSNHTQIAACGGGDRYFLLSLIPISEPTRLGMRSYSVEGLN